MAFLLGGANSASGGYDIDNSLRFGGTGSFLTRAQSDNETATTCRKFTVSTWYKTTLQGDASGWHALWSASTDANNWTSLKVNADKIMIFGLKLSGTEITFTSNMVFRDPSAWYNVVVAYDSTDGTAADRLIIYVNGSRITGTFSADLAQNTAAHWGDDAAAGRIGAYNFNTADSYMMNGYLADTCVTIGYALAPAKFGVADEDSGIWKPIKPTVTYSENGFFLEYQQAGTDADASGMGADTSGNTNHLAIDSDDSDELGVTTDTPTNNFCTVNPIGGVNSSAKWTFTEGNTVIQQNDNGNWRATGSTMGVANGKWYWEVEFDAGTMTEIFVGFHDTSITLAGDDWVTGSCIFYNHNGGEVKLDGTTTTADYGVLTAGDVLGIALNMDDKQVTFYDNGSAIVSDFSIGSNINEATPTFMSDYSDIVYKINFGNPPYAISSGNADANGYGNFEYAVPSGYFSLCTKNLAEYG